MAYSLLTMSMPEVPVSRRERKKERTRGSIYDAAMALFAERGFEAVTVEEICEAADVARGTFFLHFPTKAALIFEATARLVVELRAVLEIREGEQAPSAATQLRAVTTWMVERWRAQQSVMAPMFREVLRTPMDELHSRPEALELAGLLVQLVQRGQQSGELRADVRPELVATSFVASCSTILSVLVRQGDGTDVGRFIDEYLELLLRGLLPR